MSSEVSAVAFSTATVLRSPSVRAASSETPPPGTVVHAILAEGSRSRLTRSPPAAPAPTVVRIVDAAIATRRPDRRHMYIGTSLTTMFGGLCQKETPFQHKHTRRVAPRV